MSYQPTDAIVAAATTSLPEKVGGERNWDYRCAWVRDASFTMKALWVAACLDEAYEFFAFMTAAAANSQPGRHLQIMFGVGGEDDLSERVLRQLRGWRESGPVRVGNGAWNQPQLYVYGELLDAAFRLRGQLGEIDAATRTFLIALADAAASQWAQPDNGIWEVRVAPRHFLYSKLMCWVALERAVAMADQLHAERGIESVPNSARPNSDAALGRLVGICFATVRAPAASWVALPQCREAVDQVSDSSTPRDSARRRRTRSPVLIPTGQTVAQRPSTAQVSMPS